MKTIIKKIINDQEYTRIATLIVLSSLLVVVQGFGFIHSHAHTLLVSIGHMFFHAGYFLAFLITTLVKRRDIVIKIKNVDKIINGVSLVVVALFIGWRIYEFFHQPFTGIEDINISILRIVIGISLLLIWLQAYILHESKGFTCSIMCHGAKGHLLIDVVALVVLFIFSFFGGIGLRSFDLILFPLVAATIIIFIAARPIKDFVNKILQKKPAQDE